MRTGVAQCITCFNLNCIIGKKLRSTIIKIFVKTIKSVKTRILFLLIRYYKKSVFLFSSRNRLVLLFIYKYVYVKIITDRRKFDNHKKLRYSKRPDNIMSWILNTSVIYIYIYSASEKFPNSLSSARTSGAIYETTLVPCSYTLQ